MALIRGACRYAILFLLSSAVSAVAQVDHITQKEAEKLAEEAMNAYHPGGYLDYFPPGQSELGFYEFEVLSHDPVASPHVAMFDVNDVTGDVWQVGGSVCTHLTSPTLKMHQAEIRKRLKQDAQAYDVLRVTRPGVCDAD